MKSYCTIHLSEWLRKRGCCHLSAGEDVEQPELSDGTDGVEIVTTPLEDSLAVF